MVAEDSVVTERLVMNERNNNPVPVFRRGNLVRLYSNIHTRDSEFNWIHVGMEALSKPGSHRGSQAEECNWRRTKS